MLSPAPPGFPHFTAHDTPKRSFYAWSFLAARGGFGLLIAWLRILFPWFFSGLLWANVIFATIAFFSWSSHTGQAAKRHAYLVVQGKQHQATDQDNSTSGKQAQGKKAAHCQILADAELEQHAQAGDFHRP